jgi:hypothetical protein
MGGEKKQKKICTQETEYKEQGWVCKRLKVLIAKV